MLGEPDSPVVAAGLLFLMTVLIHAASAAICRERNRVALFLTIATAMAIGTLGLFWVSGSAADVALALVIYGFLCELYIFAFTLVLGSISANLLMRLRKDEHLSFGVLRGQYSGASMTALRLERLCQAGLLERTREGWILTSRGKSLASVFHRLKRFFRHGDEARAE